MSIKHPIIAVTGSSGAGTTSVTRTFQWIFARERIKAAIVQGDAFHRYNRAEMRTAMAEAAASGNHHFSHFGPQSNLFEDLEALFRRYGESGRGRLRKYLHDENEAAPCGQEPGTFTPWTEVEAHTDLLFYEGLHGAVVTERVNVAQHPDLLIGVVPIINLEWIQKLHRDKAERGYSTEAVMDTILRRMRVKQNTSAVRGSFEWHAPPLPNPLPRGERVNKRTTKTRGNISPGPLIEGEVVSCATMTSEYTEQGVSSRSIPDD